MRIYWIVSSTFHRFLPCILVHLTHGYRLRKSRGAYLPHSLITKDVNTGYTALIIPIQDHFRLINRTVTRRVSSLVHQNHPTFPIDHNGGFLVPRIVGDYWWTCLQNNVESKQKGWEQWRLVVKGVCTCFTPFYRLEFHGCQVELYPPKNSILNRGKTTARNCWVQVLPNHQL